MLNRFLNTQINFDVDRNAIRTPSDCKLFFQNSYVFFILMSFDPITGYESYFGNDRVDFLASLVDSTITMSSLDDEIRWLDEAPPVESAAGASRLRLKPSNPHSTILQYLPYPAL